MDEWEALQAAAAIARTSPCAKSQRGVVIWTPTEGVLWEEVNAPPIPMTCDGSETCRGSCGKICVHAEQAAILGCPVSVQGAEMTHAKVVNGELVAGGPPSCPDCSKLILYSGISGMWLYEGLDSGPTLVRRSAEAFHLETLRNCGLHPFKDTPK